MKRLVLGLLAATAMSLPAFAADVKPALLYDLGRKFDKSFNEAAYNGAEKFKATRNKAKPLAPTDHRKKTHHALRTCELESASDTEKKSGRNARYSPNGAV